MKRKDSEVFFHTLTESGEIEWQGIVLQELPLGHLRIQLFSWVTGSPTDIRIVNGADYRWRFYVDESAWLAAGDIGRPSR